MTRSVELEAKGARILQAPVRRFHGYERTVEDASGFCLVFAKNVSAEQSSSTTVRRGRAAVKFHGAVIK